MTYTTPQVSLNGTGRAELIAQQDAIRNALDALQAALIAARPHGRDYQYRPEELRTAIAESMADFEHMRAISERADAILYALWEGAR